MTDQGDLVQMQLENDALTFSVSAHGDETLRIAVPISGLRYTLELKYLTAAKLETAIAQVEELIMPMIRRLPAATKLEIHGTELAKIHSLLFAEKGSTIAIDSVESLFNQLADYASHVPSAWQQPIAVEQAALGLVVLREVMHHGGFGAVTLPHQAQ